MLKPYYQERGITIYHGDAREVLPSLGRFALCLTDPPYGVEGGHGGQNRDYRKANYSSSFEDSPAYIRTVCVPIIETCLEICDTVALTPGTRCLSAYPQPDEVGGFYSPAASRIGKFGFQNLHPIFYYGKYKNAGKGALHTVHVLTEVTEKNGHPCPKPLGAWKWLLKRCTDNGPVVDPFVGSGTTLRAAKDLELPAVGIELNEAYCEIAANRLRQSVLEFA